MADAKQQSQPQSSDSSLLHWITDAQTNFREAQYDSAADVLNKLKALSSGQNAGNSAAGGGKSKQQPPAPVLLPLDGENPEDLLDASFYHNLLLTTYLSEGKTISIPAKVLEKPEEQTSSKSGKKGASAAASSNNKAAKPTSALEPGYYPSQSIEASLADIGHINPLAWYNLAVLQFTTGNFKLASKTCEELIDKAPFDDSIAVKLNYLFLFVQLKLVNILHPKIPTVIAALEKQVAMKLDEAKKLNSTAEMEQSLEDMAWLCSIRAQISLMHSKIKSSKKEIQSLTSIATQWNTIQPPTSAAAPSETTNSITGLVTVMKAKLSDVRRNHKKAEENLLADPVLSLSHRQAFLNNLGVLAFHRKRLTAALTYFTQAAQTPSVSSPLPPTSGKSKRPRLNYSDDSSVEIAFNSGIQLLALKRYADAKKCFEFVVANFSSTLYTSNPLLWIRWGECCLQSYNQTKQNFLSRSNSVAAVLATGGRVRIEHALAPTRQATQEAMQSLPSVNEGGEAPSNLPKVPGEEHLLQVKQHFQTALMLIEAASLLQPSTSSKSAALAAPQSSLPAQAWINLSFSTSANSNQGGAQTQQLTLQREYIIRVYIRVVLAWVGLELRDWESARDLAEAALSLDRPSGSSSSTSLLSTDPQYQQWRFLAMLYQAEALLRLGNFDKAEGLLSTSLAQTEAKSTDPPETNRLNLICNLATVYVLKGDLEQARYLMEKALALDESYSPALLLQVYLELKENKIDSCIETLSRRRLKDLRVSTKA